MTHLRQIMLEELERRNYAPGTIRAYIRTVEHFARHFRCSPDKLGLDHIRQYQAAMFRAWKLAPNTVTQRLAALALPVHPGLEARLEHRRDALPEEGPASSRDPQSAGSRTPDRCDRDALSAHPGHDALCHGSTPGRGGPAEGDTSTASGWWFTSAVARAARTGT